jgi:multiple sugar transport system permease protein
VISPAGISVATPRARSTRLWGVRRARLWRFAGLYAASLAFLVWALGPIVWVFISSISTRPELYLAPYKHWIPEAPTLQNFVDVLTTGPQYRAGGYLPTASLLFSGFNNTLQMSIIGGGAITLLATFAGYVFARIRFPGRNLIFFAILFLLPLPIWVSLNPLYFIMSSLGLVDTKLGLLLIYVAFGLPLQLWLMTTFIRGLPEGIEEAAAIDGASRWQVLRHIILPLSKPGMTSAFLISALSIWNAFLIPLVFSSSQASQPVTVVLSLFIGQYEVPWESMSAATVLIILPPLALAFFFQRYLVRGAFVGSTSGE